MIIHEVNFLEYLYPVSLCVVSNLVSLTSVSGLRILCPWTVLLIFLSTHLKNA